MIKRGGLEVSTEKRNARKADKIRALKKSDSKKELGFFIISIIIEI